MPTPASSRFGFVAGMLVLQGVAWYLARYTFFDLHELIGWTRTLALVSSGLIIFAGMADFRKLPKNALAGYIIGFLVAALFASEPAAAGGSNFCFIWAGVFALMCLRGVIATVIARTIRSR